MEPSITTLFVLVGCVVSFFEFSLRPTMRLNVLLHRPSCVTNVFLMKMELSFLDLCNSSVKRNDDNADIRIYSTAHPPVHMSAGIERELLYEY